MSHHTLRETGLRFLYQGSITEVVPILVESCMKPDTYRLYPIELIYDEQAQMVNIRSLTGSWDIPAFDIEHFPFQPKKPPKRGCDGHCDECRKCC